MRVREPSKSTRKIFKSLKKGVKNKENSSKLQLLIATPVINNTIWRKKNLPNLYRVFDYVIFIRTKCWCRTRQNDTQNWIKCLENSTFFGQHTGKSIQLRNDSQKFSLKITDESFLLLLLLAGGGGCSTLVQTLVFLKLANFCSKPPFKKRYILLVI